MSDSSATIVRNTPASAGPIPTSTERYALGVEIAHGGQGVVFEARDTLLNRTVAVKILKEGFSPQSAVGRRFLDEARITGQLQHPGIPPVHDLGTLPNGRPFLAMKLIKGQTLDAILKARPDPSDDRGRFLAIFEQLCQAVAYAHAHHVIHRDLKPANVMVGAFGEVQVMDWGLAKVLTNREPPQSEATEHEAEMTAAMSEVESNRDDDSATKAGSVLGTPAYMPPEQAIGAIDEIDRRSDVFGLGAILCAMLTGKPPFVAGDSESTRKLAARGSIEEAFTRLDGCGAEPDLVALCKRCLNPQRESRPADADAVASAVASFRAESAERARQAELDRVKAEGEARTQRQKRRAQLTVVAGVFALVVVGGGAWAVVRAQAADRRADADRVASVALGRAEQLAARADPLDPATAADAEEAVRLWEQAEAEVARAEGAVAGVGDAVLTARVAEQAGPVREKLANARRDATLLSGLEAARATDTATVGTFGDRRAAVRAYRAALATAGLPVGGPANALATAIQAERPGVRAALIPALDEWLSDAAKLPTELRDRAELNMLREAINQADPDLARREVRTAVAAGDRAVLLAISNRTDTAALPPGTIGLLYNAIANSTPAGERKAVLHRLVPLLRAARDRYPTDPGILMSLRGALFFGYPNDPVARQEAIGCVRVAVALRPDLSMYHFILAQLLTTERGGDEAEPHYRRVLEIDPKHTFALANLAFVLEQRGDLVGAADLYRRAAASRSFPQALYNLGKVLRIQGDLAGAEAALREMLRQVPASADGHNRLAFVLQCKGDLNGAVAEYRETLKYDPKHALAGKNLTLAERFRQLLPRLPGIVEGKAAPATPKEACEFAELCSQPFQKQFAAAVRLYEGAFAADSKLADDLGAAHRYTAACRAAMAAADQGEDAGKLDDKERTRLRLQALAWLKADLALRAKQLESGKPADRDAVQR
jgi:tetratricopeptide (TPR) repeat protein